MSSDDIAIRVSNLSKRYEIYVNPRDRLKQFVLPRLQRQAKQQPKQYFREFWALKDVSFEIKKGQAVGIIGRNGSGKSTLLQMICGTLNPTSGSVQTNGRIAALLELGSGFNPEFTGRENVYMNASVLGLSNEQINARFNDIVAFADVGDFIEQPVKTYSSGMYVRLAFAVIVHVDADILIVDEALSVGDAFFTQKCMMRIKKLMDSGVTLLFVSHDSNSVKSLCTGALLLEHGKVTCEGDTSKVVETYYGKFVQKQQQINVLPIFNAGTDEKEEGTINLSLSDENFEQGAKFQRLQNGKADFLNVQLLNENLEQTEQANFGQPVILRMVVRANVSLPLLGLAYHIRDRNGFDLVYSDTGIEDRHIRNTQVGNIYVIDWYFSASLREGDYTISAMLSIPIDMNNGQVEICDFVPIAVQFKVWRGEVLPIYGAVYWSNKVTCRPIGSVGFCPTQVKE
jgi:lipopolysaccharide transport system ATP-binding protein